MRGSRKQRIHSECGRGDWYNERHAWNENGRIGGREADTTGETMIRAHLAPVLVVLPGGTACGDSGRWGDLSQTGPFTLARAVVQSHEHLRRQGPGVFMTTTSAIGIYTGIAARWITYVGFASAALLIFGGSSTDWMFMVFPPWVLLMSTYVLIDNLRPAQTHSVSGRP
jgi:hypothetical protein